MNITPRFYLKEDNSIKPTLILLRLRANGQNFKYSTQKKIFPQLWDKQTQRPVSTSSRKKEVKELIANFEKRSPQLSQDLDNIKVRIDNLELHTKLYINQIENEQRAIDLIELKKRLDTVYRPDTNDKKERKEITLNLFINKFIDDLLTGRRLNNGKHYTSGTIKNYEGFKVQFLEYQKKQYKVLNWNDITMDFYDSFIQYFNGKNYKTNSIGRLIKHLKVIMAAAFDLKLHSNTTYQNKAFKVLTEKTTSVYLSANELEQLEQLNLTDKPNYDLARDVFLCGCYTALRYSDYSRLSDDNIKDQNGIKVIDIHTKKTKERVIIPIRPELDRILKKYEYKLPRTQEQKINKYIKEVAKLAGFTTKIEVNEIVGGRSIIVHRPKYELIKTHTARRTAATLMYLADIPSIDIMKITGHTSERHLLKYIKVTKEETAKRLSNNSFFQGNHLKVI